MSFKDYSKEYTGGSDKSYLSVSIPVEDEIKHYQKNMLEKNKINLLLSLSVQRINYNWKLFYDITSKIPLNRVLERKQINQDTFEHIIMQIIKLTRELRDYLLDLSSVVLDTSYIYCDPSSLDLYFMYIPCDIGENEPDRMKVFLKKLLVEDISLSEDSSGVVLKRILEVLKEENFSIEHLLQCIKCKETISSPVTIEPYHEKSSWFVKKTEAEENSNIAAIKKPEVNRSSNIPPIKKQDKNSGKVNSIEIPGMKKNMQNEKEQNKSSSFTSKLIHNENETIPFRNRYLLIGGVNIILVAIFILLLTTTSISSNNLTGKITGMLLILASANYFLISRLKGKEVEPEKNNSVTNDKKPAWKYFVNEQIEEEDIILPKRPIMHNKKINEENSVQNNPPDSPDFIEKNATDEPDKLSEVIKSNVSEEPEKFINKPVSINKYESSIKRPISDKTVVLGMSHDIKPYLQSLSNPGDRIRLEKSPFLIGRLEDSVDYTIRNNAVGKIHAEIIEKDGEYYIIDLNSVNGTYINGERILCNTASEIKTGNKITFANESYTFICS